MSGKRLIKAFASLLLSITILISGIPLYAFAEQGAEKPETCKSFDGYDVIEASNQKNDTQNSTDETGDETDMTVAASSDGGKTLIVSEAGTADGINAATEADIPDDAGKGEVLTAGDDFSSDTAIERSVDLEDDPSPDGSSEAETEPDVEPVYELVDGILTVTGTGAVADNLYAKNTEITELVIGEGITSIGTSAFSGCTSLTNVSFPSTLTSIGESAFSGCTGITALNLPEGLNNIGASAFKNNTALTDLYIPISVQTGSVMYTYNTSSYKAWGIFEGCKNLSNVVLAEGTTSIHSGLFAGSGITEAPIPDTVTSIGAYAFSNCANLTTVVFPESLTEIKDYAFSACTNITKLDFTENINTVGVGAFRGNTSLTDVYIPLVFQNASITYTYNEDTKKAWGIFENCSKLSNITFAEGTTSIHAGLFAASGIKEIVLPDSMESVNYAAFASCASLKSIDFANLKVIGKMAFSYCTSLDTFDLSGTITDIKEYAFYGCRAIRKLYIPANITEIGQDAFVNCTSLAELSLSAEFMNSGQYTYSYNSNTYKASGLFSGCSALKSVSFGEGTTRIPRAFFGGTGIEEIQLPDTLTFINAYAFSNTKLKQIVIPDSVERIGFCAFSMCSSLTDVTVPKNWKECTSFDDNSGVSSQGSIFRGCSALENIIIPEGMTLVPDYAFSNCDSVTEIEIPDTVASIGKSAFYNCYSLEFIDYPETMEGIGESAFYNCSSMIDFSVPDGVETIAPSTFEGCSKLLAIDLPASVKSVEDNAFSGCSKLTRIIYDGDESDWEKIYVSNTGNNAYKKLVEKYEKRMDPPLKEEDLMGVWEGEYDGSSDDIIVRRHFVFIVGDFYKNKKYTAVITGTRTISQSLEDPTEYYADGSDSVKGYVSLRTGAIRFKGDEWIEKPVGPTTTEDSSFYHAEYVGLVGTDRDNMTGYIHNNSGTWNGDFYAQKIIMPEGSDTSVVLSMNKNHYDLFSEQVSIEQGSEDKGTIVVKPDWRGEEPGTIKIFQRNNQMTSKTGVFIDKQLGKLLDPGKTVYLSLSVTKNGKTKILESRPLKLKILSKNVITGWTTTDYRRYPSKAAYLKQPHFGSKNSEDVKKLISNNTTDGSSPPIPGLENTYTGMNVNSFVPQGFCKFRYNGKNYYLLTAYDSSEKHNSVVYVLDQNFKYIKNITLPNKYHNGGITYDSGSDTLWFCGNTSTEIVNYVFCYQGSKLGRLITSNERVCKIADFDLIWTVGNKPSCLDYHEGRLWVGTCNTSGTTGKIIGYKTDGNKLEIWNTVSIEGIEDHLNGFTFGDDQDIYISYSESRYASGGAHVDHFAVNTGKSILGNSLTLSDKTECNVPKMNEEIVLSGNTLYVLYESAATKYINDAFIVTDRITGIDKSAWKQGSLVRKMSRLSLGGTPTQSLAADEPITVEFGYDAASETDTTETTLVFTPETSGFYNLSLSEIDHQGTYAVTGVVTDEASNMCGVVSNLTTQSVDEGIDVVYNTGGETGINLTGGKTYEIRLTVTWSADADEESFSGSYDVAVSKTGEMVTAAATEGEPVSQETNVGGTSCFTFTPPETATYRITWDTYGELSGCTVTDDAGNSFTMNDEYCDLEAGRTYSFSSVLSQTDGVSDTAAVNFSASIVREQKIEPDAATEITTDTKLDYHADTSCRMAVEAADDTEGIILSVYDSNGTLAALGGNKVIFTSSEGADYKIICSGISKSTNITVMPYIADISGLGTSMKNSLVYNSKMALPLPKIVEDQYTLIKDIDYTVKYSSSPKSVGVHTVTITGTGKYKGAKKINYKVIPAGTSLSKVKAGKKSFTATWKKQAAQTTGYQIQYSLKSNFKGVKTYTVKKNKTVKATIKKLKAKKKYYVRIRTYKKVGGKTYYSAWSKTKTVKTRK